MIQVDNRFITMDADIGSHVADYYEKLFSADNTLSSNFSPLDDFNWGYVSEDQNYYLTSTPSEEEIRDAIFGLDASSSPGLDGFGG